MASNALTTGGGSQGGALGFVTSGTIDWVAFGNSILTVSTAVLQRFASAGVQPASYQSVIAIGSQFQLSYRGEQYLQVAIDGLSGIVVNSLYMGFGYRCLVREMWEMPGGVNCVALCACLAEAHTEADAAWILIELWRLLHSPDSYAPSHAQFMALIKSCAGVTAKTQFGQVISRMLGDQYKSQVGATVGSVGSSGLIWKVSKSKDVSKVLAALFKVSCGRLDSITVIGGSECAFVAALALWLFDLRVWVEGNSQNLLFSDVQNPADAQVLVQYSNLAERSAVMTSSTYTLPSYDEMFGSLTDPENQDIYLIPRQSWDDCLSGLYGVAFERLQGKADILATYLGSVARIYEGLALGARFVENISFLFDYDSVESAYGLGFVNNILSTFPELGRMNGLQTAMTSAAQVTFEIALRLANVSVVALEAVCVCTGVTNIQKCPANEEHMRGSLNQEPSFCIASIAFAIRDTARITARIVRDPWYPNLKPSLAGLVRLRQGHQTPWKRQQVLQSRLKSSLSSQEQATAARLVNSIGLKVGDNLSRNLRPQSRGSSGLYATSLLFHGPHPGLEDYSGRNPTRGVNDDSGEHPLRTMYESVPTAVSMNGICCYYDTLRSLSSDVKSLNKVHVIPGYINYQDRRYDSVCDPKGTSPQLEKEGTGVQLRRDDFHKILPLKSDANVEACVTELSSGRDLQFFYRFSATCGTIPLRPGQFARQILHRRRKIFCDGTSCKEELALPCFVMSSFGTIDQYHPEFGLFNGTSGVAGCIWPCPDDATRCMILAFYLFLAADSFGAEYYNEVVLRDGECLPCCTASYLKKMSQELSDYDRVMAQEYRSDDPGEQEGWAEDEHRYRVLHIIM
ncbi:hypothetical protein MMC11_006712 [Xylographa trunciseda]|nr:hypothetical protein [Xylographa trunciseda]